MRAIVDVAAMRPLLSSFIQCHELVKKNVTVRWRTYLTRSEEGSGGSQVPVGQSPYVAVDMDMGFRVACRISFCKRAFLQHLDDSFLRALPTTNINGPIST